jgi:hypothetical protein
VAVESQAQARGTHASNAQQGQLAAKVQANKSPARTPDAEGTERIVVSSGVRPFGGVFADLMRRVA